MSRVEALSLGRALARRAAFRFEADPGLPILSTLRDPAGAAEWCLRRVGDRLGLDPALLEEVEILRYRPARRCALRFRFGGPAPRRVYVKLYRPRNAERVARTLAGLAAQGPWADLRIPAVLAFVPEDGAVILEEVRGMPFSDHLARGEEDGPAACATARAVLRLHGLDVPDVGAWTAADELAVLMGRRESLLTRRDLDPRQVDGLYRRISVIAPILDSSPPVLLHRDLHPQQILLDGRSGALVDLDDAARGPAEIDLGNLLAHLDLFAVHLSPHSARITRTGRLIRAAYESSGSLSRPALRVSWAASLLRLAGLYATVRGMEHLTPQLLLRTEGVLSSGGLP